MPKTIYQSCVKALEGRKGTINLDDLKALIMMHIGSQERTIKQALQTMSYTNLIKDIGDCRFEIQ